MLVPSVLATRCLPGSSPLTPLSGNDSGGGGGGGDGDDDDRR